MIIDSYRVLLGLERLGSMLFLVGNSSQCISAISFSKGIHPKCYLFSGVFFYIDLFKAAPACFFGLSPGCRQDIGLIEGVAAVLSAVGHPVVGESVQGFIFGSTMYKL